MLNIILIAIDSLRPDHLSCYGYRYSTSRYLDKFCQRSLLFSGAYCSINATDPSITSLFTGREPHTHGVNNHGRKITSYELNRFLAKNNRWLTSELKNLNYTTIGIDWLGRWHKKDYDEYPLGDLNFFASVKDKNSFCRNCKRMTDLAIAWLQRRKKEPYFLFIHYWDVHKPYNYLSKFLPLRFPSLRKSASMYDAAIYTVDQQMGRIFAVLSSSGAFERSVVIVTSDHGESLGEHGIYDHHGLYECSIRIPLIIYIPGYPHGVIDAFVQNIDIMPTLLSLVGVEYDGAEFDGSSLLPLMRMERTQLRTKVFFKETFWEKKYGVRTKTHKLIIARNEEEARCSGCHTIHGNSLLELYDLTKDFREMNNIYSDCPDVVTYLEGEVRQHFGEDYCSGSLPAIDDGECFLDEEQQCILERLKGLGYY